MTTWASVSLTKIFTMHVSFWAPYSIHVAIAVYFFCIVPGTAKFASALAENKRTSGTCARATQQCP
jgi:hypothetical protein